MLTLPVYLDYNATTPCDPRVLEAMLPYFTQDFGNAASRTHVFGWKALEAVDLAREQVAQLLGAEPQEIIFTSGATEACNFAVKGVFETYAVKGRHIITSNIEHKAVLDTCRQLEKMGAEVTYLPVNGEGLLTPEQVEEALQPHTILIAVMAANNETGTVQPIAEIGALAKKQGVLFFTDATQATGKIAVDVQAAGIDLLALSAHKMYGPKGVGALYVRRKNPRVKLAAQLHGGDHERGLRSGTLNVPGIVGLGKACSLCGLEMQHDAQRLGGWRNKLETALLQLGASSVNGSTQHRLPQVTNMAFKFVDAEGLMRGFGKNLALSSGSACSSATLEPSYVLRALGLSDELARGSLRFGLGRFTTEEQVDYAIAQVSETVQYLRELNPEWTEHRQEAQLLSPNR